LALVFLGALKALNGKELKVTPSSFMLVMLIPLLAGCALIGVGSFLEFHEQPELCGEYCHAMWPIYDTYEEPGNNSIMAVHATEGVTCLDCHTGAGVMGQVDAYAAVPHEAWYEVTGKFDPEDMGGEVKPENCLKCHDGELATLPAEVETLAETLANPHSLEADCVECHTPHEPNLGLAEETCAICHGTAIKDFDDSLVAHGERVGRDCMECHDRAHPDDAEIDWASVPEIIDQDFCSDCHVAIVDAYTSSASPASLDLYGDCTDCHTEHNLSTPPHLVTAELEDCTSCHVNFGFLELMHNRTGVSYLAYPELGSEFCEACHEQQVKDMDAHGRHSSLDCQSCHEDHKLQVRFEDCASCHDDEVPAWHDETTTGCWNSECHGTWFYHD
jgi:hypothetical protein